MTTPDAGAPATDNLTLAALVRYNQAGIRRLVYGRSWDENTARAEALANVPHLELSAEDWHELDALTAYFADYPTPAAVDEGRATHRDLARYTSRILMLLVAMALICAFLGFLAGKASATGFGIDVDFTVSQDCDGYTLHLAAHPDAEAADVYVWGDATNTKDPTQRKVAGIAAGGALDLAFTRTAGTYSGGVSLHYTGGRQPSNRTYTVIVHGCATTTAAPPTTPAPPIVEPSVPVLGPPITVTAPPTFSTVAPPSTAQPMCEPTDGTPPFAGPCPTTTTSAAPASNPTAPTVTDVPPAQPATPPTDAPRVGGEVVTSGQDQAAAVPVTLPRTGADGTTGVLQWAVAFFAIGVLLVLSRFVGRWTPAGRKD